MTNPFKKAEKKRAKLRVALDGPAGSGKTYTALICATEVAKGAPIAVIDTERGSASLYSDLFKFDMVELSNFNPKNYIDMIHAAEDNGYAVIVIDSLSHSWEGEGGSLDQQDAAAKKSGNSYAAYREVNPLQRRLLDTIINSRCHVIVTMRSKMEYTQEKNSEGRTIVKKIGVNPIAKPGAEYEFTIVGDMDVDHNIIITKSRCPDVDGAVAKKPGREFFIPIMKWLETGKEVDIVPPSKEALDKFAELLAMGKGKILDEDIEYYSNRVFTDVDDLRACYKIIKTMIDGK